VKSTLQKLFRDESGFIISTELVLVATLVVIGMVVGLSEIQHAVVAEMNDVADAIGSLNQSYMYSGFSKRDWGLCWPHARTFGSTFYDAFDECDNNQCDLACDLPLAEGPKTAWVPGPGPGPWVGGGYGYSYGGAYAGASSSVVVEGMAVGSGTGYGVGSSAGVVVGSGDAAAVACPSPNPYAPGVPAGSAVVTPGLPCGGATPCDPPVQGLPGPGPMPCPPGDAPCNNVPGPVGQ
jgi:Flp pilus assembly pilin Flp